MQDFEQGLVDVLQFLVTFYFSINIRLWKVLNVQIMIIKIKYSILCTKLIPKYRNQTKIIIDKLKFK